MQEIGLIGNWLQDFRLKAQSGSLELFYYIRHLEYSHTDSISYLYHIGRVYDVYVGNVDSAVHFTEQE